MIDEKILKKAREAGSAEELKSLAEKNGISLKDEQAQEYFESLHKVGEVSDDELDSVSGGGCGLSTLINVNGIDYTVVSSWCSCFTGMYQSARIVEDTDLNRRAWFSFSKEGQCGHCRFLRIGENLLGYCSASGK